MAKPACLKVESSNKPPKPGNTTKAKDVPPTVKESPTLSALKAYWLPLLLFSLSMLFQLIVLPSSFPTSHYDVLGVRRGSSSEEVREAYAKLSSNWDSGIKVPEATDFIKIRYAFELLQNPLWKRDYDLYGIDEYLHVLDKYKQLYSGDSYLKISLPLLEVGSPDVDDGLNNFITSEDFKSLLWDHKPLLLQIYSRGSNSCAHFVSDWKRIVTLLDEVALTGVVEAGDVVLSSYFTEKKVTGQSFFRNGLPKMIAFPPGCTNSRCMVRYEGELSVDAVTDWFASRILDLPRIPYYSKESLGPRFLARSGYHKVKVIFFSNTGMRATPFTRQIAKKYQDFASFALVLHREEEYSFWWTVYDVEAAPATVFIKDPGTKPLVHYGPVNSSWFLDVMEQNKLHELPQLRIATSMELGCDARGYSRAGSNSMIWYCVIALGRPSPELNKIRETLRKVLEILSSGSELDDIGVGEVAATSVSALKEKRLTFAWMDGEVQKNLCTFYIGTELSLDACGPSRGIEDVPQVVIVRYMRNDTVDATKADKKRSSLLDSLQDEVDPVSQLVARFNGSAEIPQIVKWVSKIIEDGDSNKLPFFRTKTPALVPENSDSLLLPGSRSFFPASSWVEQAIKSFWSVSETILMDPRIGPALLLVALMSFGRTWLQRNQSPRGSQSNQSPQQKQSNPKREVPKEWRNRGRIGLGGDTPPSMTDCEPKNSYQMPLSDSDSD